MKYLKMLLLISIMFMLFACNDRNDRGEYQNQPVQREVVREVHHDNGLDVGDVLLMNMMLSDNNRGGNTTIINKTVNNTTVKKKQKQKKKVYKKKTTYKKKSYSKKRR